MKLFLDDSEFDAQLQRTATAVLSGSADLGEMLATASRVAPGDLDDWFAKWSALAEATCGKADAAAKAGSLGDCWKGLSSRDGILAAEHFFYPA